MRPASWDTWTRPSPPGTDKETHQTYIDPARQPSRAGSFLMEEALTRRRVARAGPYAGALICVVQEHAGRKSVSGVTPSTVRPAPAAFSAGEGGSCRQHLGSLVRDLPAAAPKAFPPGEGPAVRRGMRSFLPIRSRRGSLPRASARVPLPISPSLTGPAPPRSHTAFPAC